ncbi:MAG: serine/threonine protein phosphatase [Cellvibrionaceae bacterium]|nr:serine/threonine protein phosphatase [Cellvibrionaceae bacterium]|tara:strand:+ start:142083 stop:142955 length:873 start_codon:yes stop_codon:yes gene_type:complete
MPQSYKPRIAINGRTDIGQVRNENEDNIRWHTHSEIPFGYVVVADGMGGYSGGAAASSIAVNTIGEHLEKIISPTFQACTPQQQELMIQSSLIEAINAANSAILETKELNPQFNQMGTTVAIAVIWQKQMTIAHLGDSRAYLWDKQGFVQLTKDHSLVQEMIDSGSLTEDQARHSQIRNQITRALGVSPTVEPAINNYALTQNSLLMLCSDGLTEYLDNGQLDYVLSTHRPALECCYRLIDDANLLGGKDNISVGIIEYTVDPNASFDQRQSFTPPPAASEDDVTVRQLS